MGPPLFKKGNQLAKGRGRPPGSKGRYAAPIVDAIIEAAMRVGRDGKGKDGLVGYLEACARKHPKQFLAVIARVIPVQVQAPPGSVNVTRVEIVGVRPKDEPSTAKVIELDPARNRFQV